MGELFNPNHGASSEAYYNDAMTDNTFGLQETHKSIKEIHYNSWRFLNEHQINAIDCRKVSLTRSDFIWDTTLGAYYISVYKDFVISPLREVYRLSDYYDQVLTMDDITQHNEIFAYVPIVFVDGVFNGKFRVRPHENITDIIFDHVTEEELNKITEVFVVFSKNHGYATCKTNKNRLLKQSMLDKTIISISKQTIDSQMMYPIFDKLSSPIITFWFPNKKDFLSYPIVGYAIEDEILASLDENGALLEAIKTYDGDISVYMIDLHGYRFDDVVIKGVTDPYSNKLVSEFAVDYLEHDMPIPPENILALRYLDDVGQYVPDGTITIRQYYPNIYRLEDLDKSKYFDPTLNKNNKFRLCYLYDNTNVDEWRYENKLKHWYNFLKEKYPNKKLHEIINYLYFQCVGDTLSYKKYFLKLLHFDEYHYDYSVRDFEGHGDHPYHFDYKASTLQEFIDDYPWNFSVYLDEQCILSNIYSMECKDIDLSSRYRTDNSKETPSGTEVITLSKPCYVFAVCFLYDTPYMRYVIDGNAVVPEYSFFVNGSKYIYFDASIIKQNSVIRIEEIEKYYYTEEIKPITGKLVFEFDITETLTEEYNVPTIEDLNIIDNYTGLPIPKDDFTINPMVEDYYVDLTNDYTPLNKFKITIKDSYINKDLKLIIYKGSSVSAYNLIKKEFPTIEIGRIATITKDNIRVYVNGRLLSDNRWQLTTDSKGMKKVYIVNMREKGTKVVVDVTPSHYELLCKIDLIPENGVIDLWNYIDKPFSLRYFDVYVNGRTLDYETLRIISPAKIKVGNIKSRKHFYLYGRDRNEEFYKFGNKTIYDEIIDDPDINEKDRKLLIKVIIGEFPDPTDEEPDYDDVGDVPSDIDVQLGQFYQNEIIPIGYVTSDDSQLNEKKQVLIYDRVYAEYFHTRHNQNVVYLPDGSDSGITEANVIIDDPDIYFENFEDNIERIGGR